MIFLCSLPAARCLFIRRRPYANEFNRLLSSLPTFKVFSCSNLFEETDEFGIDLDT